MRLLATFKEHKKAETFSNFLLSQGIENQCDSKDEAETEFHVWVIDEDQYENALHWYSLFQTDQDNPLFERSKPTPLQSLFESQEEPQSENLKKPESQFPITYALVMICTLLFLTGGMNTPSIQKIPKDVPLTPVLMAPVAKTLLYDYPKAWEYIDQLIKDYGVNALEAPQDLPNEGKLLLYKFYNTPYWHGYYDKIMGSFKKEEPQKSPPAPLFEKIREGEVWRLFTPAFLHFDLFHIFFNMIWLIVLGRQIENKIGGFKYIIFILLTASISNTGQYLMSGPNFIGFSGVVMAMIGFIYARQITAAWEGYQLTKSTLLFVMLFIGSILFLQLISFFVDIAGYASISPPIANTAHILGALIGFALGKLPWFSWKN